MRKQVLVFTNLLLLSLLLPLIFVNGDVPSVLEIDATISKDETLLIIEVRHSSPTSRHFVDSIEIRLDDGVEKVFSQDPQSLTRFSVEITLDSSAEKIEVRAHCITHGWSKWATFEGEPQNEEPKGIPGFPFEAILIGLIIGAIFLWITQRRN